MKFYLMEILISLFLAAAFIFLFKKRFGKKVLIGFTAMILLFGIFAGNMVNLIPIPTEPVTLTALDDKNEASTSTQVAICKIIVDEKEYPQKNPSQGKWFWRGDELWWRPESDSRQPDGLTQTIVLDIPIGNSRIIEFASYENRGILKVESGDKSNIIDTYVLKGKGNVSAVLAATSPYKVVLFKLFKLAVFALIIAALAFYPIFAILKFGNERVKGWFGRNWDKLYYASVAIIYVLLMQKYSVDGSFWGDELWQLGWIYSEFAEDGLLFFFPILKKWFLLMPYGQENLLLLSQLFVAGAIYFTGLIGNEYKNKRFGVLLSSTIAFSTTIIDQCAMELRPYAILLFATAVVIYTYLKKQKYLGKEKISLLLIYGTALTLCMDSHPYGLVVAGLFLLSDLLLIILKKATKKTWIEYVFPVIYGVIWLILSFNTVVVSLNENNNVPKATIERFYDVIQWLFGYNNVLLSFFVFGTIVIIAVNINKIKKQSFSFKNDYTELVLTVVPLILSFLSYFFSTVVNPNNSLLYDRYFISIIICLYFVTCRGIDIVIEIISNLCKIKASNLCLNIFAIVILCMFNWSRISPWSTWEGYGRTFNTNNKAAVEYVMLQNDIYSKTTIFFLDNNYWCNLGLTYYTTQKGKRDDIIHYSVRNVPENIDSFTTIYLSYNYKDYNRKNAKLNSIIDNEFKLVSDDKTAKVRKYVRIS